jgi:hypothetical protein
MKCHYLVRVFIAGVWAVQILACALIIKHFISVLQAEQKM